MADPAAARALLAMRDGGEVSREDFRELLQLLTHHMYGTWPGISEADAQDAANETIERLLSHRDRLAVLPADRLVPYAIRVVRNVHADRWRSRRRELPLSTHGEDQSREGASDDDAVLSMLDRAASLETVRRVLLRLGAADDHGAVSVLLAWLDLAQRQGAPPTSREVGTAVGMSHTAVSRALKRARHLLTSQEEVRDP